MSLVIPVGYAEIQMLWSLVGDPELMGPTFAIHSLAGNTVADMGAPIADAINDYVTAVPTSSANVIVGWQLMKVGIRLNTSDAGLISDEEAIGITGAVAGETPPQNCCYLVKKLTSTAGRKGRGRMYEPCWNIPEGDINKAGVITGGTVSAKQATYNGWFSAAAGSTTYDLVLLHTNPADTPSLLTGFMVEQQIATQRRRLRK